MTGEAREFRDLAIVVGVSAVVGAAELSILALVVMALFGV
jgi:hypothetical protein